MPFHYISNCSLLYTWNCSLLYTWLCCRLQCHSIIYQTAVYCTRETAVYCTRDCVAGYNAFPWYIKLQFIVHVIVFQGTMPFH